MKQDNLTEYTIENLIERIKTGDQLVYLYFWGHRHDATQPIGKSCLSQWFKSPFVIDGITYATAEHYMMAAKAQLFNDNVALEKIRCSTDPAEVKKLGRQIVGYSDDVWQAHRFDVVKRANLAKFSQNENLRTFLRNTNVQVKFDIAHFKKVSVS